MEREEEMCTTQEHRKDCEKFTSNLGNICALAWFSRHYLAPKECVYMCARVVCINWAVHGNVCADCVT